MSDFEFNELGPNTKVTTSAILGRAFAQLEGLDDLLVHLRKGLPTPMTNALDAHRRADKQAAKTHEREEQILGRGYLNILTATLQAYSAEYKSLALDLLRDFETFEAKAEKTPDGVMTRIAAENAVRGVLQGLTDATLFNMAMAARIHMQSAYTYDVELRVPREGSWPMPPEITDLVGFICHVSFENVTPGPRAEQFLPPKAAKTTSDALGFLSRLH